MPYTECKHHFELEGVVEAAVGVFRRYRLGLASDEVARILQVVFHLSPNGVTSFIQALSPDPDERFNLGVGIVTNDQNLIAMSALELMGVMAEGPLATPSIVIPLPGGIDVAGDVTYAIGVGLNVANCYHGCSVYYERRKARPGEREAIIMAHR